MNVNIQLERLYTRHLAFASPSAERSETSHHASPVPRQYGFRSLHDHGTRRTRCTGTIHPQTAPNANAVLSSNRFVSDHRAMHQNGHSALHLSLRSDTYTDRHPSNPQQPWRARHIVKLPSGLLGLENFTVHPVTPPLGVVPIQIPGQSTYALQLAHGGDDLSRTPYVAALLLKNNAGCPSVTEPHTSVEASLSIIYVPDPTKKTLERNAEACPKGMDCVADEFGIVGGDARVGDKGDVLGRLVYAGFEGHWEAVKDVVKGQGWEVYWVAAAKEETQRTPMGTEIVIEVVKMK